ncbi:MAG: hypothetical protein JXB07_05235 [Anaerolineae bacterium]|nr:hypothetical protein [Anaerolineae bacterium]
MLAWTVLLVWADRKPLERKDVMLFTTLIVVVKNVITVITEGFVWSGMWVARLGTMFLFAFSYINVWHAEPLQTQKTPVCKDGVGSE